MGLSIFERENVTFLEVLEFIIKFLLLFDTSSLFTEPEELAELEGNDIFAQCFEQQGGGEQKQKQLQKQQQKEQKQQLKQQQKELKQQQKQEREASKKMDAEQKPPVQEQQQPPGESANQQGQQQQQPGEPGGEPGQPEAPPPPGGITGEGEERDFHGFSFKSEFLDLMQKGSDWLKNKIIYLMSIIAFGSIYPAVPFFVILATIFALLKWAFSKIRML